jgi:hypothetical protein
MLFSIVVVSLSRICQAQFKRYTVACSALLIDEKDRWKHAKQWACHLASIERINQLILIGETMPINLSVVFDCQRSMDQPRIVHDSTLPTTLLFQPPNPNLSPCASLVRPTSYIKECRKLFSKCQAIK